MRHSPTVFIVDDDQAVRDALGMLLEAGGYHTEAYPSAQTFLEAVDASREGCLLLDVRMPGMSGLDLQTILQERGYKLPVIILTGHGDVPMAVRAMKGGAMDFIEKPFQGRMLLDRVAQALEQDANRRRNQIYLQEFNQRLALLSPREREVLERVAEGHYNKVIAAELGISISTVEAHRKRVMEKLQAHSVADLVRMLLICKADSPGSGPGG